MIADSRARQRTGRCDLIAATVDKAKCRSEQHRCGQRPPSAKSCATTSVRSMRVSKLGLQARDEFGARAKLGNSLKGTPHAVAHGAAAGEVGTADRTAFEVTQNFVVRFGEQFLRQKRIRHLTNVTTVHG